MGTSPMTNAGVDNYREMVEAIQAWRTLELDFLAPPPAGHEAALRDRDVVRARAIHFGCDRDRLIGTIGAILNEYLPDSPEPRLCRGDINLFNCLVTEDGKIAGVVDWEQAQLGDPLSDWGLITVLASLKGLAAPPEEHPLAVPAFERSRRPVADLRCWMLHQMYKLVMSHQIWSEIGDAPPWYTMVRRRAGCRERRERTDVPGRVSSSSAIRQCLMVDRVHYVFLSPVLLSG